MATEDIQQRLSKARQTFYRWRRIGTEAKLAGGRNLIVQNDCKSCFDVWLRSLETHGNRSKEAGRFPIQIHETHTENKVATDHLTLMNPADYKSERSK